MGDKEGQTGLKDVSTSCSVERFIVAMGMELASGICGWLAKASAHSSKGGKQG